MFASLPLPIVGLAFVVAAVAVWLAGVRLATTTERLSDRFGLGQAIGGIVILAIATNLPEIAISISAALSGNVEVAVGNILGGIAIQTVVLVIIDAAVRRRSGPLTYRANSLVIAVEGLIVVVILATVLMATQLPVSAQIARVGIGSLVVAALWLVGLDLVRKAGTGLPWRTSDPDDTARKSAPSRKPDRTGGTRRTVAVFTVAALVTLIAGSALEETGTLLSDEFGLSGVLFGATFLALATSLPEISTGIASARDGDDQLAISDIFGGNAFLPVLFVMIGLIAGRDPLLAAQPTDLYLTALGIVLTVIFVVGLIFRSRRTVVGVGRDSLAVVVVYVIGLIGLIAISVS